MSTYTLKSWWQNRREAARCFNLREELWLLLYGKGDEEITVQRAIDFEKYQHPGESESWYLEKIIYDLRKRFSAY